LAVLKLAILVSGVLALAKLGFLDFIAGGFDTGRFGGLPMTFPTPHIGHSRHGLFFTRWIVNAMLNLLKRTMTYPGFELGNFGVASALLTTTPFRSSYY
jgi:hypothetical protein